MNIFLILYFASYNFYSLFELIVHISITHVVH